jgi:hypothetical protein
VTGADLETPIRWPLRGWLVAEVFFGLAAISSIFLRPQDTATNFAWPIKPDVMAATLGAFYLAAAFIFVLPLFAKTWQEVRVMILPAAAFCTAMLVATFLHWDKFSTGTFPFYLWFASYLLPPPIFVALYVWHQRDAAPVGAGIEVPLPQWARTFFRVNGLALLLVAAVGFLSPGLVRDVAPWSMTHLTVRTLCGWFIPVALLQVWLALEGDWRRARVASMMLMALPVTLAIQLGRFADQVDWGTASLWVFLLDVTGAAVVCAYLWVTSR